MSAPKDSEEPSEFCECCGGHVLKECSCEWGERYCVDRIEGGEASGPGYYIEWCTAHDKPGEER